MTARQLLTELTRLEATPTALGDRLVVEAPRGVLTADHRANLAALKPELLVLLGNSGATMRGTQARSHARRVAVAKLSGEVADVRPGPSAPEPCHACHSRRFWRSVRGPTVCATCHPPAIPELVAEWLETEPDSGGPDAS